MVTEEQNPEEKQQTEEVVRRMNGKGDLDLSNPEAIILDALGLARYQDVVKNRSGVMKRLDLFGGPIDGGAWDAIQEYIGTGSKGRLSPKEEHYLDLLNLVFSLDGQHGKRNTIKFLTSPYFGLGYEAANNLWSEAIEMFYANRKVSKDALRAKTADQLDQVYVAALNAAKTTKDFKQAAEILAMKAQVLGLDKEDAQLLQRQVYRRTFRVVSLDPESIGLPKADRRELKEIIDGVLVSGVPETERRRIEMEAGIIDFEIQEYLVNESQAAD